MYLEMKNKNVMSNKTVNQFDEHKPIYSVYNCAIHIIQNCFDFFSSCEHIIICFIFSACVFYIFSRRKFQLYPSLLFESSKLDYPYFFLFNNVSNHATQKISHILYEKCGFSQMMTEIEIYCSLDGVAQKISWTKRLKIKSIKDMI